MKKITIILIAVSILFTFTTTSKAALHDRGKGLVYDDVLNITWLQNANYMGTAMNWTEAVIWAESLTIEGYNDWRLPETDTSCSQYDCINSEMGHLFYINNITAETPSMFMNIEPRMYWSATEHDSSMAWRFNFSDGSGYQGKSSKTLDRYAWAVREGDSLPAVAPEPVSSLLFLTGGVMFISRRQWLKLKRS